MPYLYAHALNAGLAARKLAQSGQWDLPVEDVLRRGILPPPFDTGGDPELSLLYRWGAQGPDVWFYHFVLHPVRSFRRVGNLLHAKNVEATLSAMLTTAMESKNRSMALAYFAGFLTHYALDKTAHPYVHSLCGGDKYHTRFEAECDAALLELCGTDPGKTPPELTMPPLSPKQQSVFCAVQGAAAEASGITGFEKPLRLMAKKIPKVLGLQHDPKERKRRFFSGCERVFCRNSPVVSRFFFPLRAERDVLNLSGADWTLPWSGETKTTGFLQLIDDSSTLAAKYIRALCGVAAGDISSAAALEFFGGDSFDNGLPWRESFIPEPYLTKIYEK